MFSFRETYFRLVGLFDWVYARTQFLLLVSRNRYGFTLAGYQNEKSATDPALVSVRFCFLLKKNNNKQMREDNNIYGVVFESTCWYPVRTSCM